MHSRHYVIIPVIDTINRQGQLLELYAQPNDKKEFISINESVAGLEYIVLKKHGESALMALQKLATSPTLPEIKGSKLPNSSGIDGNSAQLGIALVTAMQIYHCAMEVIIATGELTITEGCIDDAIKIKAIGHLTEKLIAVLDHAKAQEWKAEKNYYFFVPKDNSEELNEQQDIVNQLKKQGVLIIEVDNLKEALDKLNIIKRKNKYIEKIIYSLLVIIGLMLFVSSAKQQKLSISFNRVVATE
jgi:hypothetical protein